MTSLICPGCGSRNRLDARFCQQCGLALAAPAPPAGQPAQQPLQGLVHPNARYAPVGNPLDLAHSSYHRAHDLTCSACRQTNSPLAAGRCQHCQAELPLVLLRQARRKLSSDEAHNAVALSGCSPFILPHLDVVRWHDADSPADGETYLVLADPPRPWRSPVKLPTPAAPEKVVAWATQIGQAMAALHDRGFALYDVDSATLEGIIIDGQDVARLADLSSATRLSTDDPAVVRQQIARDTAFLAKFIHYLTTGYDLRRRPATEQLGPALRSVVVRGVRGEYGSMAEMLAELSNPSAASAVLLRSLRQNCGVATHAGRVLTHNEDAVVGFSFVHEPGGPPIGFYLVADGMGGQAAGEVASETINRVVARRLLEQQVIASLTDDTGKLTDSPSVLLSEAIQEANQTVLEMNRHGAQNMGAVVVAALIVNDQVVVANVGDSRAYLCRAGQLEQFTTDHSVVARLVETGAIKAEQVRTHPSRNQVYRSLGDKSTVEIDVQVRSLSAGDRLMLCCDGLWEMLPDTDIRDILVGAASPQAACDALVQAANAAGGEDNISVIVVQME